MEEKVIEESAKTIRKYLDPMLLNPLAELGLLVRDKVAFWRFQNQVKMLEKTVNILRNAGLRPEQVRESITPDLVIPLIEAAGTNSDEDLSDMFAHLLARSIDPETHDSSHPSYSKVLSQLSPLDARILKVLYLSAKDFERQYISGEKTQEIQKNVALHRQFSVDPQGVVATMKVRELQAIMAFQNLRRLGICDQGHDALNFLNRKEMIALTDYGYSLCILCVK